MAQKKIPKHPYLKGRTINRDRVMSGDIPVVCGPGMAIDDGPGAPGDWCRPRSLFYVPQVIYAFVPKPVTYGMVYWNYNQTQYIGIWVQDAFGEWHYFPNDDPNNPLEISHYAQRLPYNIISEFAFDKLMEYRATHPQVFPRTIGPGGVYGDYGLAWNNMAWVENRTFTQWIADPDFEPVSDEDTEEKVAEAVDQAKAILEELRPGRTWLVNVGEEGNPFPKPGTLDFYGPDVLVNDFRKNILHELLYGVTMHWMHYDVPYLGQYDYVNVENYSTINDDVFNEATQDMEDFTEHQKRFHNLKITLRDQSENQRVIDKATDMGYKVETKDFFTSAEDYVAYIAEHFNFDPETGKDLPQE